MKKTEEKKGRFIYKDLGEELLVYDELSDKAHFLNGTAREIFLLLQKNYSHEEIEKEIRKKFKIEDSRNVGEDIRKAYEEFKARGLI
jgi:PqqD family protein of HPr-rel-A system